MSSMIITCGDCGARFRLDTALLKDSNAARIRCRKCGGRTVVRLHEESPVPVPPPQETIPPSTVEPSAPAQETVSPWPAEPSAPAQEWVSPWPVEPSAPAQEPPSVEADISGGITSEPIPPPPEEKAVHPANVSIEPEPAQPGTVYSRVEDLFAAPPGKDAGPDWIPLSPEEQPAGENPPEEVAATEAGRKAPSRRAPFTLKVLVMFVLWVLLLAGGTMYIVSAKLGREPLGKVFPGWGSTRPGSVAENATYDIRDVKWSIEKETASGTLFVVKGSVANVGNVPSAGIRIQATLLGKDNEALAEKATFAGNPIDEAMLRQIDRAGIEGAMSNRFGAGNVNKEIPPGKALPFMVIFMDPPGQTETVMVKAVDAQ